MSAEQFSSSSRAGSTFAEPTRQSPSPGEQLHDMGGRVRDAASQMGAQMRETLHQTTSQLQEKAGETAEQLREQAREYYEVGREQMQQYQQNIESRIREKPLQAIAIAAGVGMIAGIIFARR